MLAVLVLTDAATQLYETATYCKPNDELRPLLVGLPDFTTQQVCPETGDPDVVESAYPDGWYVRIMFDELLDPSIEELSPIFDEETGEETGTFTGSIVGTHPVELECRSVTNNQFVSVDYDGYYSPSGNRVTWPVGPSLVIKPNDPTLIATNTECQITLNDNILDKDGLPVPDAQRGPFPFKVSGIKVILMDPPVDDPDYESPVDAVTIFYDNIYAQFNTAVDLSTLCPDQDPDPLDDQVEPDGLCDNDTVFALTDDAHPAEGPGYCDSSYAPCGTFADCPAGMGDTLCGKGFCDTTGNPCNKAADCGVGGACGTSYVYDYVAYGGTNTEVGIGPAEPIETDRKYTFQFKPGVKLKDRCGRETTLPMPDIPGDDDDTDTDADNNMYARFITEKFDLNDTTILTGEVANANKRLQWNFNNALEGQDTYTSSGSAVAPSPAFAALVTAGNFTMSPLPKQMTQPCTTSGCTLADVPLDEIPIISGNYDGQTQLQGHLAMNTEYTVTLKQGAVIKDFYGKPYTVTGADQVIKWKTQPAIVMTGIAVRNTGQLFSITDKGTLTKDSPGNDTDIRFSFNASIDTTTFDLTDVKIEPAVPNVGFTSASGCGYWNPASANHNPTGWIPACTVRLRGYLPEGQYKITFLKDAKVKDIFGLEYTHPADTTITIDVVEAPAIGQCL